MYTEIFAQTDPSIIAAVLAATGAIVAGIFSLRSKTSADLVDDVMADREWLRMEVVRLRTDIETIKMNYKQTEMALLACRENEKVLRQEMAELRTQLS